MNQRYHPISARAHWLTVILLVAVYALIELKGIFVKGSEPRELMKHWHFMLGLFVLLVAMLRIVWRIRFSAPPITPNPPAWMMVLAKLMHLALYVFLLGMPLLGWAVLSAAGKPIPFFGLDLPPLLEANKATAGQLKELHELLGKVGYVLIGGHAVAGLYHHFIVKDDTLVRMLPTRK